MSPIQNFEQHACHLVEADLWLRHTCGLHFLDGDGVSVVLLLITKPQLVDNHEHKLRNIIIVEILHRLPHSEVLRPFVQDLLKVAMQVLTICIRIGFDLLRNFRPTLDTEVQPFLDFEGKFYQNFGHTVSFFFESGAIGEDVKPPDTSDQLFSPVVSGNGQLNPSIRLFKIVTESPLVVMNLFQLYSRLVQTNIPNLLPLIVSAIAASGVWS